MKDIDLQQLERDYATNQHRKDLLNTFRAELTAWRTYLAAFDIWLLGSYLTDKDTLKDIDVLLAGQVNFSDVFPPKLPRIHDGDIHVCKIIGIGGQLVTRDELIKKFNEQERNAEKGIQISAQAVAKLIV